MKGENVPRAERYTVLAVGEGNTEVAFLRHLKALREIRGTRSIDIQNGHGGDPGYTVERARRLANYRSYRKVLVWVDADRIESDDDLTNLRREARGMTVLVSKPCVEAFFLGLLEPETDWAAGSTLDAKRHFHQAYLPEGEKTQREAYTRFDTFSHEAIEVLRRQLGQIQAPVRPRCGFWTS